jgi:hypothetical protein
MTFNDEILKNSMGDQDIPAFVERDIEDADHVMVDPAAKKSRRPLLIGIGLAGILGVVAAAMLIPEDKPATPDLSGLSQEEQLLHPSNLNHPGNLATAPDKPYDLSQTPTTLAPQVIAAPESANPPSPAAPLAPASSPVEPTAPPAAMAQPAQLTAKPAQDQPLPPTTAAAAVNADAADAQKTIIALRSRVVELEKENKRLQESLTKRAASAPAPAKQDLAATVKSQESPALEVIRSRQDVFGVVAIMTDGVLMTINGKDYDLGPGKALPGMKGRFVRGIPASKTVITDKAVYHLNH